MSLARERMSLAASFGADPVEAIRRTSAHIQRMKSSTAPMPSMQEPTAKPNRPEIWTISCVPLVVLFFGIRVAGSALALGQLSLAGRYRGRLSSCIVCFRMMHFLIREGDLRSEDTPKSEPAHVSSGGCLGVPDDGRDKQRRARSLPGCRRKRMAAELGRRSERLYSVSGAA
jgi:hypothetical protein